MKKLIFTFALLLACCLAAQAQDYKTALGLRFGYPTSISFKHFISEPGAIEVFAGTARRSSFYRWTNLGLMYQHHSEISSAEGLRWYAGGGAAIYFWSYDNGLARRDDYGSTSLGVIGVLGLDYKFADIPLNLSVDWIPTLFLGDGYLDNFRPGYGALSARYTFN